jgi:hypothetical protein
MNERPAAGQAMTRLNEFAGPDLLQCVRGGGEYMAHVQPWLHWVCWGWGVG